MSLLGLLSRGQSPKPRCRSLNLQPSFLRTLNPRENKCSIPATKQHPCSYISPYSLKYFKESVFKGSLRVCRKLIIWVVACSSLFSQVTHVRESFIVYQDNVGCSYYQCPIKALTSPVEQCLRLSAVTSALGAHEDIRNALPLPALVLTQMPVFPPYFFFFLMGCHYH